MDTEELKYTRVEYERRFLVSPQEDWKNAVETYSKIFEDKYLRNTRLRLRILTDSDTGRRVIKLSKKAEPPSYAKHEVTDDPFFEGGNLCRATRADLLRKLSMFE